MIRCFLEPLIWTVMILEISKNGKEWRFRICLLCLDVLPGNLCTFSHIFLTTLALSIILWYRWRKWVSETLNSIINGRAWNQTLLCLLSSPLSFSPFFSFISYIYIYIYIFQNCNSSVPGQIIYLSYSYTCRSPIKLNSV